VSKSRNGRSGNGNKLALTGSTPPGQHACRRCTECAISAHVIILISDKLQTRALHKKLRVVELLNKFPKYYWAQTFFSVYVKAYKIPTTLQYFCRFHFNIPHQFASWSSVFVMFFVPDIRKTVYAFFFNQSSYSMPCPSLAPLHYNSNSPFRKDYLMTLPSRQFSPAPVNIIRLPSTYSAKKRLWKIVGLWTSFGDRG
jgi:hypothetical protein